MKSPIFFYVLSTALAAPTRTIEERQLPGLGGSGSDSGIGSIASLFPGLGSSSSSGDLPSISDIPGLGGSSSSSGLGALSSLFPGASGSGSSGSSTDSGIGALSSLFPSSGSSGSSLGDLPGLGGSSSLTKRQLGGTITENGVSSNDGCQPLTFIFARGSTEMGNMGSVVGPPVASALRSQLNNKVTVQGVDYDAGIAASSISDLLAIPFTNIFPEQCRNGC